MPTPRGYPFPAGTDPADVPADIQALAEAVDTDVADVESDVAAALNAHAIDATAVHGIADTAALYRAGGTDVAVADGGTGASTAAAARTNLGIDAELALKAPLDDPALTGTVTIDGDTNLYRLQANYLKTDDTLVVGSGITTPGTHQVGVIVNAGGNIRAGGPNIGAEVLTHVVDGSAWPHFGIRANGDINWGSGAAAYDTNLYRASSDVLKTDGLFAASNGPMLAHALANQKVISGRVDGAGNIVSGSGFSVTRVSQGVFTVDFTSDFSGVPHVVGSASTATVVGAHSVGAGSVSIQLVRRDNGLALDDTFSFVAVGVA